jgi:hypothetical protein
MSPMLEFLKSVKQKENSPVRRKFAPKGWQEFILRGISVDQACRLLLGRTLKMVPQSTDVR